jgi:S-adenosylmethionine hydrolase
MAATPSPSTQPDSGYATVTFLSDYGRADEFVGVVHAVIHAFAPGTTVIDLTHDIAPYDVRAGGLCLARSAQYLNPGVVLAVVDPGVGTARRAVAVEVGDGASVLVGPDNGLLAPAVAMVGGATRAVQLDNPEYQLPAPGPTFAGRDVLAPAAAHLCRGVPLGELGSEVDPATLLPATIGLSRTEDGRLVGEVLWVDRYGNAQLNLDPEELDELGEHFGLRTGGRTTTVRRFATYAELPPGGVGLLVDSYGMVAVAATRASAAEALGLAAGDEVALEPLGGSAVPTGAEMRVELRTPGSSEHGALADAPDAGGRDGAQEDRR